jgi:hypothetical protein
LEERRLRFLVSMHADTRISGATVWDVHLGMPTVRSATTA